MNSQLEDWLQAINGQFGNEEIPYIRRPFEAISRLSAERKISVTIPSPLADDIFKWFEEHSAVGAHAVGSMFTSAFYYDAYFWKLEIPIAYGTVQLNALDALTRMPQRVKAQLQSDRSIMWRFVALWVDSMDYAYGIDDLGRGSRLPTKPNRDFAVQLTSSAHRELEATARLLAESQVPNAKALETARMATEIFLKAYLAVHGVLVELEAQKKFGHNLEKLLSACQACRGGRELDDLSSHLTIFPSMGARYEGTEYENQLLWSGFAVALRTAVTFTRSLTDRDNRAQMLGPKRPYS